MLFGRQLAARGMNPDLPGDRFELPEGIQLVGRLEEAAVTFGSDRERVEHLFPLYEALVQPTSAAAKANKRTDRRVRRTRSN